MSAHVDCSCGFKLSRRSFLGSALGGFAGFAAGGQSGLFGASALNSLLPQDTKVAKAKAVIALWMVGGPSQFETFSPAEGSDNGGPTKALETSVRGIHISENLPRVAKQMEDIAIVRSITSRESDHQRGRYLMHTGYSPQPVLVHPSVGSVTAMELGKKDFDLPEKEGWEWIGMIVIL